MYIEYEILRKYVQIYFRNDYVLSYTEIYFDNINLIGVRTINNYVY